MPFNFAFLAWVCRDLISFLSLQQLEFHGVMRFYYQSSDSQTGQKVATKCIRVSSTATTKLIIENLIEKFRPDMKMLEVRPMPHNSPIYNEYRI